jgi:hypothetical protein
MRRSKLSLLSMTLIFCACGSSSTEPGADGGTPTDAGQVDECAAVPDAKMTFFVTEAGALSGDLGGLAGADTRCTQLAAAVGISGKTWAAYLSAENDATFGRVDAVDRIGDGPWFNAAGVEVGNNAQIHSQAIAAANIVSECGRRVTYEASNPRGDRGAHDIFTGSTAEGVLEYLVDPSTGVRSGPAATCGDWTSSSENDAAMVGHSDHETADDTWNFAHYTLGCHEAGLRTTAANGRIYCFATN